MNRRLIRLLLIGCVVGSVVHWASRSTAEPSAAAASSSEVSAERQHGRPAHQVYDAQALRLQRNLRYFQPKRRFAILVNALDELRARRSFPAPGGEAQPSAIRDTKYSVWDGKTLGSLRARDMEALISGSISLPPYAECRPTVGMAAVSAKFVEQHAGGIGAFLSHRSTMPYEVHNVFPFVDDQWSKFRQAIRSIREISPPKTLTMVHIRSCGSSHGVLFGGREVSHSDLLDEVDSLPGNKVVVALGCHSGALVDVLKERRARNSYVAITSCSGEQASSPDADDQLDGQLWQHMKTARPLSELVLQPHEEPVGGSRTRYVPRLYGSFDTTL